MKAGMRGAVVAVALMTGVSAAAAAQTDRFHIGPQISYDFDVEEIGLGAQFSLPIMRRLEFYPSFVWYFTDDPLSFWNLNADLKYRVVGNQPHWLYVGGGANFARASVDGEGDTDIGLNLFAGAESLKGRIHPFGEARLVLGDGSRFQLVGGLNITFH